MKRYDEILKIWKSWRKKPDHPRITVDAMGSVRVNAKDLMDHPKVRKQIETMQRIDPLKRRTAG